MAQNDIFPEAVDPELAALLNASKEYLASQDEKTSFSFVPSLNGVDNVELVEDGEEGKRGEPKSAAVESAFPSITKRLEDAPHKVFSDPNYYKAALSEEGDKAQRVHASLQKYIHCTDVKDKGVFRQQVTTAYWDFLSGVARKAAGRIPEPKKFLLRFGVLHPVFLKPDALVFLSKIVVDNEYSVPVYYLDEWFKAVGTGTVQNSSTNEVQPAQSNASIRFQRLLKQAARKRDSARGLLIAKSGERQSLENVLMGSIRTVVEHSPLPDISEVNACYTDSQKRMFGEMQELIKRLLKIDQDMNSFLGDCRQADRDAFSLRKKVEEEGGTAEVDVQAVDTEFETIRQMAKMTIGRQGNHFPVLTSEYFRCGPNDMATRENVIAQLAWIESIDPEAFCRVYKNQLNRIVPLVILLPTYGDTGICWEPFDRYNRATSPGRIAVPMYPKSLLIALLSAVADLRWQVAKEKSSFYWMEEGLTGNYYQWFSAQKLKGDVKEYFIQDYITWMTKESGGTQKLDKEIRGIFWRYLPFAQPVKEKLKTRSFIYQELYQRDINRSRSDGY
ncbi:MAG: hypothetical protein LBF74_11260 [Treponema sp.]|jgi:hypothetical protein|nr:hypothetical protein [Treponema sp.]